MRRLDAEARSRYWCSSDLPSTSTVIVSYSAGRICEATKRFQTSVYSLS